MTKLVQVWSGDPTYGNAREGVFYMEPPYVYGQFKTHAHQMAKRWTGNMPDSVKQTSKFKVEGPFRFLDVGRRDLSPEHEGDDEWVLIAWFKDDNPTFLPIGEIEDRRLLAQRYGLKPPEPLRYGEPVARVTPLVADEMDEYMDPNGLNEAGVLEESKP